jgi:hypothetical protein
VAGPLGQRRIQFSVAETYRSNFATNSTWAE